MILVCRISHSLCIILREWPSSWPWPFTLLSTPLTKLYTVRIQISSLYVFILHMTCTRVHTMQKLVLPCSRVIALVSLLFLPSLPMLPVTVTFCCSFSSWEWTVKWATELMVMDRGVEQSKGFESSEQGRDSNEQMNRWTDEDNGLWSLRKKILWRMKNEEWRIRV